MSGIEWTEKTWNPVAGCSLVSPGCTNCYAQRQAHTKANHPHPAISGKYRGLTRVVNGHPVWTGTARLWEPALSVPRQWRTPRLIFVNSMSDLFHESLSDDDIHSVFDTMEAANWHTYQVLTKRHDRLRDYLSARYRDRPPPRHVWLGVSVEDRARIGRIDSLRDAPASVRFISAEPLLGPLGEINLEGIHWLIAGGESGPGYRPMNLDWARELRDQCIAQGVRFLFKQSSGPKSGQGRVLDGRLWDEYPA